MSRAMWNQASWSQTLKNYSAHESHSDMLLYCRGGGAISRLHECLSENSSLNDSNRADFDICPDLSELKLWLSLINMKNKNWQKMSQVPKMNEFFLSTKKVLFDAENDPFCPFWEPKYVPFVSLLGAKKCPVCPFGKQDMSLLVA